MLSDPKRTLVEENRLDNVASRIVDTPLRQYNGDHAKDEADQGKDESTGLQSSVHCDVFARFKNLSFLLSLKKVTTGLKFFINTRALAQAFTSRSLQGSATITNSENNKSKPKTTVRFRSTPLLCVCVCARILSVPLCEKRRSRTRI